MITTAQKIVEVDEGKGLASLTSGPGLLRHGPGESKLNEEMIIIIMIIIIIITSMIIIIIISSSSSSW